MIPRPAWPGCTVGVGGDFPDPASAIAAQGAIASYSGMAWPIQIGDGTYVMAAPLLFEMWASAKKCALRGANAYNISLTALVGNVLTVSDATNIAIGNYILSGDKQCPGAFKVLAVAGNQVTVSGLWTGAAITTPVTARVIKTVLQFHGMDAVRTWNGGAVLNIADIVFEGDGLTGFGCNLQDAGGRVWIGAGMVGFVGFQDNVIAYYNAQINGDGTLIASGAARDNMVVSGGSALSDLAMVSVNAGRNGISSRRGVVEATAIHAISVGSANKDFYCYAGGVMVARNAVGSSFFAEPGGVLVQ